MIRKKEKKRPFDLFFDFILGHPFISISLVCLMLLPFGFAEASHITTEGIVFEAIIWILALAAIIVFGRPSKSQKINIGLVVISAVVIILFSMMTGENSSHSEVMFIPAAFILFMFALVMRNEKTLTVDRAAFLLMVLGVFVRYCFVLTYNSAVPFLQHDVGNFTGTAGHEAYIMYWYKNGLVLPDFDVTKWTYWQFYHPPFHHITMALVMNIFTTLGLPLDWAQEAIQIMPMIYSALSMVACYRIFKLVNLEGAGLVVAMLFPCFYPTFIIWSGAYNNDMLATLFMLLAMLCTLKWYKKPTLLNILPIALCVGFGMMTKLSAWMVAPAIAFVFLWVFIKNIKTKALPLIGQYAVFGVVSVPLGLWWGIRNFIEFETPLTFVPDLKNQSMSVANIPVADRLFDFSLYQFDYPFLAFANHRAPYNEFNPFMGLVKTSIFDEYHIPWTFNEMATALVIIFSVVALISFGFLVLFLFKKDTAADMPTKLFFIITLVTIVVCYYIFCFKFPYVCTENIRYCIPIIPILALGLGFGVNTLSSVFKSSKTE